MRGNNLQRCVDAFFGTLKKHRLLLLTLCAAVVFVTTYLLVLPAMTLDSQEAARQGGIDLPSAEKQATDMAETEGEGEVAEPADAEADAEKDGAEPSDGVLSFEGDGYAV